MFRQGRLNRVIRTDPLWLFVPEAWQAQEYATVWICKPYRISIIADSCQNCIEVIDTFQRLDLDDDSLYAYESFCKH